MTRSEKWRIVVVIVAISAMPGAGIGAFLGWRFGDGPASVIAGGLVGLSITAGMVAFDTSWAVGLIPRRWREGPFLVVIVSRSLVWLTIIVAAITAPLALVADVPLAELTEPTNLVIFGACLAGALLFNFVAQVNRLLGPGVLIRLMLGRYHRPREEVRVFLFIDLKNSTVIAERLGNLRFHDFLKRFIGDVTYAADRHDGEVARFVGDEILITWEQRACIEGAKPVRAVFAMLDMFDAGRESYLAEFGVVPDIWAGAHAGPVVTGDIGTIKHQIVYTGDTPNTAARVEQATRVLGRRFLASSAILDLVELPEDVEAESLGPVELRGIGVPLELHALSRR